MTALVSTEMFQQIYRMYDEFRIRSLRVKITPTGNALSTTAANTCNIITAFDRNGLFAYGDVTSLYLEHPNAQRNGLSIPFPTLMSYSSKQSKQLLTYQTSSVSRNLAAAGGPDSFFFPTAFGNFLKVELTMAQGAFWQDLVVSGYSPSGVAPHGFMPSLLIGIDGNGATAASDRIFPVRIDWEFDVVVRGLRQQQ